MFLLIHHLFPPSFFFLYIDCWIDAPLSNKFAIFWYSIIILLYQPQLINNLLSFVRRYVSFIWFIGFCLIIWRFFCRLFWNTCYFINNFFTNQNTSCICCFLNCSFWSSFYCICCRFLSTMKKVLANLLLKCVIMFLAKHKKHFFYIYSIFWFN